MFKDKNEKQPTVSQNRFPATPDFLHASGPVQYQLTSDLMFHLVFQQSHKALIGLISAILCLSPERIISIEILNPIDFGSFVGDKIFILDLKVLLNDNTVINFEMQMQNEGNWKERSLSYLCRLFDQLASGQDYMAVKPVYHIAFLNFDLPDVTPEFYSTYLLSNQRNHEIYTRKFSLSVINLNHIELATAEDRKNHIDDWARLFKSTTWEEIRMLAAKNEYMQEASEVLWKVSAEDRTRELNAMHEEALRRQRYREKMYAQWDEQLKQRDAQLKQQETQLQEQKTQLQEQKTQLQEQKTQLQERETQLQEQKNRLEAQLTQKDTELSKMEAEIARLQSLLSASSK